MPRTEEKKDRSFIWATTETSAKELESAGLILLYYDDANRTWIFLNDSNAKFQYNPKGMAFTNKMYI